MVRCTVQGQRAPNGGARVPRDRHTRSSPLARRFRTDRLIHTLVPAVAFAVVIGSGLGHATPSAAMPQPNGAPGSGYLQGQPSNAPSSKAETNQSQSLEISTYVVHGSQTLAQVAKATGRSESTLIWANTIQEPDAPLEDGTELRVPSADGIVYTVEDGDTLADIAATYNVKVSDITSFAPNQIQSNADLEAGKTILIPNADIENRGDVVTYVVQKGDTIRAIAARYGLKPITIMGVNHLDNYDMILVGQKLVILPTDGVMVDVQPGQTLADIAAEWGVTPLTIANYGPNDIANPDEILVGQQLIIPGVEPPHWAVFPPPPPPPAPAASESNSSTSKTGETTSTAQGATTAQGQADSSKADTDATASTAQTSQSNQSAQAEKSSSQNAEFAQAATPTPVATEEATATPTATEEATTTPAATSEEAATPTATAETSSDDATAEATSQASAKQQSDPDPTPTSTAVSETQATKPDEQQGGSSKKQSGGAAVQTPPAPKATQPPEPTPTPTEAPPPPPPPTPTPTPEPQPAAAEQAPASQFIWPVSGTLTQKFGPTSFASEPAYGGYAHFHTGIDIANAQGTPIHAAAAGTVAFAGWNPYGYGYCVQINHGGGFVTLYGHMASQPAVSVGEHVSQGQYLGPMGSTGNSTGSHTHFEIKLNGAYQNPFNYLP